jgi:hypothetical protein
LNPFQFKLSYTTRNLEEFSMAVSSATIAARLAEVYSSPRAKDCNCPEMPLSFSPVGALPAAPSAEQITAEIRDALAAEAAATLPTAADSELFGVLMRYLEQNPGLKSLTITLSK